MTTRERRRGAARAAAVAACALLAGPARADKGHLSPSPVSLSEPAQRAIVLHRGAEELLVLGVELEAAKGGEVLEFIPFPAEPKVSRVDGDPFAAAGRLVAEKRLAFEGPATKGGVPTTGAAVAVTLRARIGLHDVTVVRVDDARGFEAWVRANFPGSGEGALDLGAAAALAAEYVRRGCRWFVFDRVSVEPGRRAAEPLAYRFRSERIYYPLRTSNLVGGQGTVQLVLLVPGTLAVEEAPEAAGRFWSALRHAANAGAGWRVSTSAKITAEEAGRVVPGAVDFFARTPKLYVQVLEFTGAYRFADDLAFDPADLRPFARKPVPWSPPGESSHDLPGFSEAEVADYCEANPGLLPCAMRAGTRPGRR